MECQSHEGQQTVIACVTCSNKLLCPTCIDCHTQGHTFQSLQKVASQIQQQLNELSSSCSKRLSDIRQDIRDTEALQKEQDVLEHQACDKINSQRQLLHTAIDEFADNLIKTCKQRKDKNMCALQDREDLLSSQNSEITKTLSEIDRLMKSENFAEVIGSSKSLKPPEPVQIHPTSLDTLEFYTSQISEESIDSMFGQMATKRYDDDCSDFLGSLQLQTPASLSTSQILDSDVLESVIDEEVTSSPTNRDMYVVILHPSVPGYVWTRWSYENQVQLTHSDGHVVQTVKLNKQIKGLTTTPDNRLLICGWEEKCIYQVLYSIAPSVYFKTTLRPYDIFPTDNGDLFVSMVDSDEYTTTGDSKRLVCKYNSTGEQLSCVEYDSFGDRLFVRPWRLRVNKANSTLAVLNDSRPGFSLLILLDTSLNLKLRYDGKITEAKKRFTPSTDLKFLFRDVAFNSDGNILVTDALSHSILLLGNRCQKLKTIWKDNLRPVSLCVHNNGELWCSFKKKGTKGVVKIVKTLK